MNKGYSLREMIVSTLESEKDKNFTSREITLQRISASVTNSLSAISFPNATLFTAKPKLSWKYVSDEEEIGYDDNTCCHCGRPFD